MENNLPKFIDSFIEVLSKDKSEGSYYYAWQANIAMAFQDEFFKMYPTPPDLKNIREQMHTLSNNAAKRFLDQLIATSQGANEPV